ncbi:hypothetical protein RAMDARK_1659 [Rickettsia amblyommatis str. Darkwater]|nr:hypothetical protein RAMDARK_1659 [Rickettsia amblyommatis str. Darkwater]
MNSLTLGSIKVVALWSKYHIFKFEFKASLIEIFSKYL